MGLALWFLVGFVSLLAVWRLWTFTDRPRPRCPTPLAIVICVGLSGLGPLALLLVIGGAVGNFVAWIADGPKARSWWTTPLGDK